MKVIDAILDQPPAFAVENTPLSGVKIVTPRLFGDARGFFLESFNQNALAGAGIREHFVQDNHSRSARGVLRGLHYQLRRPQGKLVRVVAGEIFDVVVDLRRRSATFGRWHATRLSAERHRMLWVPPGFAHGFLVLSESADVLYKTTEYYDPQSERVIRWDDPALAIGWPLQGAPCLSDKDRRGAAFCRAEVYGQ